MLHTNRGELNQLYNTFCRVWAAGGQATLTTSSLDGKLTAKLEIELGQPTGARHGAPHQHEVPVSGARLQPPPTGALDDLATEDQLPRLSLEPGLQHIRLQKLLKQQLCHFPRKLNLNRLLLLLHQDPPHFSSVTIVITLSSLKTD